MNTINIYITEYMEYCQYRKHLDSKTIKAYKIDLKQYTEFSSCQSDFLSRKALDLFITELHKQYKPKTVKRKIASLKAFFSLYGIPGSNYRKSISKIGHSLS